MEFNTYKVKMDEFGPAFAEEMCDRVFDKDTVQVFDYGSKTKAVYDELIGYYEDTEVYYDFLKEKYPGAFNFYVYGIMSSGYFELRENLEPMEMWSGLKTRGRRLRKHFLTTTVIRAIRVR